MCTSPLHIKTKKRYLDHLSQVTHIHVTNDNGYMAYDVPCGKCDECRLQRISDYTVRCYYEFLRCEQTALFCTLTYNDANLPVMYNQTSMPLFLPDYDNPYYIEEVINEPSYKRFTTWYKPHVSTFLKKLNEKLIYYIGHDILGLKRLIQVNNRRYITDEWKSFLSSCPRPIKYFVTCERGTSDIYVADNGMTRQGTARPHYHAIIFINHPLLRDSEKAQDYIKLILDYIKLTWTYGNSYDLQIQQSNEVRPPIRCIEYVCKYVCKDLQEQTLSCCFSSHCDKLDRQPFVLLSKSLGDNVLDGCDLAFTLNKGLEIPTAKGNLRPVNPPRYNVLKATTYRITGEITENSFMSKSRVDKGLFYDDSHPSPFFFFREDDFNDIKPLKYTKVIKTPLAKELDIKNHIRKAQHYADKLQQYQHSINSSLWKITETPLYDRNYYEDIDILHSVSPDEMYLFILNDLYRKKDQFDNPDSLYQCFIVVRSIINTLTILKNRKRKYDYQHGLTEAISTSPELFNMYPL